MSVWVVCPSKRPAEHVEQWATAWRERGYKIGVCLDGGAEAAPIKNFVNVCISAPDGYRGYARSVNALIQFGAERDPQAEWFIAAGDDIYPDPNKSAEEIAQELREHFSQLHHDFANYGPPEHAEAGVHPFTAYARTLTGEQMETVGVMQPTGDRWGENPNAQDPRMRSAYIDRVAGSAWIGREFARRMYQGNGPLWSGYTHQFVDEELQNVAIKYGVFWQRPDLTQLHQHWGRPKPGERMGHAANMPDFLKEANSPEHWDKFKKLFEQRKAAGFPGSEPL